MSRSAVILRNVACNWTGFLVNAVITLALTPYLLHTLGVGRYGVWILASSIIGYYGLLDIGLRAGVTQYLTRCIAIRDFRGAGEVVSTAVALLAMLAGVMVLLSVGGALLAPRIFDFGAEGAHEAGWCILLLGMSSALQFAFAPFGAVFVATQRLDIANFIGVGTRLVSALAIVLALHLGWGLVGLAAVTLVVNTADYIIRWRVARHLTPELKVTHRSVRLAALRDIASFGAWNFLISLNAYIYSYVPNLLIGTFQPMAAVGHYALANNLTRQVNSVLSPIGLALYPAATELHSQGDGQRLRRLYQDGSRLMMLVMIPIVLCGMVWASDFYRLWIGEKYLTSTQFESVAVLFRILLLSVVTNYVSSVAQQILTGAGHIRPVALALFGGSVISLSLSVLLIQVIGLAGVAVATVVASIAIDLIVVPIMLQRLVGLSITDFLRSSCVRPVLCGMLQAAVIFLVRLDGAASDWTQFVIQGIFAGFGMLTILV